MASKTDDYVRSEVFNMVYEDYQEPIVRYLLAKWVHDEESACDLCQETFARFWKFLMGQEMDLPQIEYYIKWLYTAARNLAIDKLRHNKLMVFQSLPEDEAYTQFAELAIEGEAERTIERLTLQRDLAQLPPRQQECLVRMYYKGFKHKEIAAELGISESAVSAYVSKGITELRSKIHLVTVDTRHMEATHLLREFKRLDQSLRAIPHIPTIDVPSGLAHEFVVLHHDVKNVVLRNWCLDESNRIGLKLMEFYKEETRELSMSIGLTVATRNFFNSLADKA